MTIIDLKPVRRCGKCFRLIPASMDRCPYCQGAGYMKPEQKTAAFGEQPEGESGPHFSWKDLSPKTKRYIYIGLAALAAIIAACVIWNYVAKARALNKSIFEPLDESVVMSQAEKDMNFARFYQEVRELTGYLTSDEDKEAYKDITYNDFLDFYNCYSSQVYCNDIKEKTEAEYGKKIMEPMKTRVDSVKAYWDKYVNDHDISKYISVKINNFRFVQDWDYSCYPAWFYTVNIPKGNVKDCHAKVEFKDNSPFGEPVTDYVDLAKIKDHNSKEKCVYLSQRYAYGDDYWDSHSVELTIQDITLNDGTVIKANDIENVPPSFTAYLADPSDDNTCRLIIETIDNQFPFKAKYAYDAIIAKLKEKSPKCFELIEKVEKATEKDIVSRGFEEPTLAEGAQGISLCGAIDGKYNIVMQLSISGDMVTGSYYYISQGPGKRLSLSGKKEGLGITLQESDNGTATGGTFKGTLSEGEFSGFYTDANGKEMPFELE